MDELPRARVLADVRKPHPIVEDHLNQAPIYAFLHSNKSFGATKFLVRNVDENHKNLLELALQQHPDRASNFRIRHDLKSHREFNNIVVEAPTNADDKSSVEMLSECCNQIAMMFEKIRSATLTIN